MWFKRYDSSSLPTLRVDIWARVVRSSLKKARIQFCRIRIVEIENNVDNNFLLLVGSLCGIAWGSLIINLLLPGNIYISCFFSLKVLCNYITRENNSHIELLKRLFSFSNNSNSVLKSTNNQLIFHFYFWLIFCGPLESEFMLIFWYQPGYSRCGIII